MSGDGERQHEVPLPPDLQEQEVEVFLEEARRLLDHHWRRADAFERKAVGVLAYVGVVIALLPPIVPVVLELKGPSRALGIWLGAATVVLLAASAATTLGALQARRGRGVSIDQVRRAWLETCTRLTRPRSASDAYHATQTRRDLVEMLLHGTTADVSPVQSMSDDADRRGSWFRWCVWCNVLAFMCILALTVTTALGRL
ncbi:hypothetical protein [Thermomonospora umbrina]|uniref:Pycsar effector protein domain-containing protein n=1 Tax=Thermomonospora umbrina TaxID=111806 RepID=A0A3D9SX03_9ACTN|nr:hypothetical protein [Thermomonospora umbrina]REF00369.1 hypothetical protein DFJ69_5901 [Thermomonospora umbrina]